MPKMSDSVMGDDFAVVVVVGDDDDDEVLSLGIHLI